MWNGGLWRKMITELEILKSKAIQTEKEAEQAKQKYIDACRRKGIPEEKIEKAKADMKDFKAFKDEMLDLRLTLCYRDALEGV